MSRVSSQGLIMFYRAFFILLIVAFGASAALAQSPGWMKGDSLSPAAEALLAHLEALDEQGLEPEAYGVTALRSSLERNSVGDAPGKSLDAVFGRWYSDISLGRLQGEAEGLSGIRDEFLASQEPQAWLAARYPQHRYYRGLLSGLVRYREFAEAGGWPSIPLEGGTLHPGDDDPRVVALRARLALTGELAPGPASTLFDAELKQAVEEFQRIHGLEADGIAGANTLAAMNVPVEERVGQIALNLERWRRTSHDLGNPYILVDIAAFDVQGVRNDVAEIEMRAIVGKLHHETPVFSGRIRYIEFNPYWNLTPSITRHETIPKQRADAGYLASKHIRVFDSWSADARELDPAEVDWQAGEVYRYKFRQDPGPWNALGTMKFIFPNEHSVYLHDTPNHDLFEQAERDFSHGCIRLSEPAELAEWVLSVDDSDWDAGTIDEVLASQERTVKNLETRLAVHLTYETAWVDQAGALRFAPDVYGRDAKLAAELAARR